MVESQGTGSQAMMPTHMRQRTVRPGLCTIQHGGGKHRMSTASQPYSICFARDASVTCSR